MVLCGLEFEATLAAGGAAGGREWCSCGVRRSPTPRSESARVSARLAAARSIPTCAAVRPRASSARSAGSGANGTARARNRDAISRGRGGWRARGTFARRAAIADAALEERESVGAATYGALGVDARGGEAARFVDSLCGLGRGGRGAGSRSRCSQPQEGRLADARSACAACGGSRRRAQRARVRRRRREAERAMTTRSAARPRLMTCSLA